MISVRAGNARNNEKNPQEKILDRMDQYKLESSHRGRLWLTNE